MDRDQKRVKLSLVSLLILAVCVHALPSSQTIDAVTQSTERCRTDEYKSSKGHCCNKCFPGYRLEKECDSESHRSKCEKCEAEQFLENSNSAPNCFRCKKCREDRYEKEVSPCTIQQNRICDCVDGYYRKDINPDTFQCLKCKTCGEGEQKSSSCMQNKNTVCECKVGHYRSGQSQCTPCTLCDQPDLCSQQCINATENLICRPTPEGTMPFITLSAVFAIFVCGFSVFLCVLYKRNWKSRQSSTSQESQSSSTTESLISCETQDTKTIRQENSPGVGKPELSIVKSIKGELPDCVPCEFNASEFIYFLLDRIPLDRFKELVRCLGVPDRDIERAERDNHTVKEAQYQMLRMWSETGSRGKPGSLSHSRLVVVVDTLMDIGLAGCAEAIEEKYGIQQA